MRPAKTQISLGIRPVWSVFAVRMNEVWVLSYPLSAQRFFLLLLCWGLTSQSTIFQSCRDGAIASLVINQYFRGVKCLAQGHNTAAVGFEPRTSRSGVRHSTTEPPHSPLIILGGCPGWSVFAGRTCHFVSFVMRWLIYYFSSWLCCIRVGRMGHVFCHMWSKCRERATPRCGGEA